MRIFVLTGAGLSAESGIPTFRDAQTGIWAQYDPMQLASPQAFARDPGLVHAFYSDRRAAVHDAAPNPAHHALARLQRELRARGGDAILCTQNVDDLLERAGAAHVIHMHGSLMQGRCLACDTVVHWPGPMDPASVCPACAATRMRPHVVWFDEVPLHLDAITAHIAGADQFAAIGTSGTVYPAAGLVDLAREAGIPATEINLAASDRAGAFDRVILGRASEAVPSWVDRLLSAPPPPG